jgi:UDP-N-acetylmuramoyl-tripeptide--D-alanyl-D-alanine ligase
VVAAAGTLSAASQRGLGRNLGSSVRVVDDSYNSNPEALVAAVETLTLAPRRRLVVCAGDMLELGGTAESLHRAAGRRSAEALAAHGPDNAFLAAGAFADALVEGASHLPRERRQAFPSATNLAEDLAAWIRPGDLVLVKGSRGARMEVVVAALAALFPADTAEEARG